MRNQQLRKRRCEEGGPRRKSRAVSSTSPRTRGDAAHEGLCCTREAMLSVRRTDQCSVMSNRPRHTNGSLPRCRALICTKEPSPTYRGGLGLPKGGRHPDVSCVASPSDSRRAEQEEEGKEEQGRRRREPPKKKKAKEERGKTTTTLGKPSMRGGREGGDGATTKTLGSQPGTRSCV